MISDQMKGRVLVTPCDEPAAWDWRRRCRPATSDHRSSVIDKVSSNASSPCPICGQKLGHEASRGFATPSRKLRCEIGEEVADAARLILRPSDKARHRPGRHPRGRGNSRFDRTSTGRRFRRHKWPSRSWFSVASSAGSPRRAVDASHNGISLYRSGPRHRRCLLRPDAPGSSGGERIKRPSSVQCAPKWKTISMPSCLNCLGLKDRPPQESRKPAHPRLALAVLHCVHDPACPYSSAGRASDL